MTSALAADDELAGAPVEVIEAQSGHLAGTKTEPEQHDQDCIVPPAERRSAIAGTEQRAGRLRLDPPGQRRTSPAGHGERRAREISLEESFGEREPEEGAQSRPEVLGRGNRDGGGLAPECSGHLARSHLGDGGACWQPSEESPRMVDIAADRARSQRSLGQKVGLEGSEQRLARRGDRLLFVLQLTQILQHLEQTAQPGPRPLGPVPPVGTLEGEELLDPLTVEPRWLEPAILEPPAEARHLPRLVHYRSRRVAAPAELPAIALDERDEGSRHSDSAQSARLPWHGCLLVVEGGKDCRCVLLVVMPTIAGRSPWMNRRLSERSA
jgi:hypothetical protein